MKVKRTTKNDEVVLTAEGMRKLQEEYHYLVSVKRREIVDRLTSALEQESSLVGNVAYDQILTERDKLEEKVTELENMLSVAKIKRSADPGKIEVGTMVTLEVEGEKEVYTIVGSAEVDGSNGKISYESPLGSELLGKSVGDTITIEVPAGKISYKILALS